MQQNEVDPFREQRHDRAPNTAARHQSGCVGGTPHCIPARAGASPRKVLTTPCALAAAGAMKIMTMIMRKRRRGLSRLKRPIYWPERDVPAKRGKHHPDHALRGLSRLKRPINWPERNVPAKWEASSRSRASKRRNASSHHADTRWYDYAVVPPPSPCGPVASESELAASKSFLVDPSPIIRFPSDDGVCDDGVES
jgi:hypothetical protein